MSDSKRALPPEVLSRRLQDLHERVNAERAGRNTMRAAGRADLGPRERKLTDDEVATAVGMDRPTYWALRTGRGYGTGRAIAPRPYADHLLNIAEFFEGLLGPGSVTIAYLTAKDQAEADSIEAQVQLWRALKSAGLTALHMRGEPGPTSLRAAAQALQALADQVEQRDDGQADHDVDTPPDAQPQVNADKRTAPQTGPVVDLPFSDRPQGT